MERDEVIGLLSNRIPRGALDVAVLGNRVYFSMPDPWVPDLTSGIFSSDLDDPGRNGVVWLSEGHSRWQYRR